MKAQSWSSHGPPDRGLLDAVHSQSLNLKKHPRSRIPRAPEGAYYTSAEGKRLFELHLGHVVLPARPRSSEDRVRPWRDR